MFKMQNLNVIKIALDITAKAKLEAKGFKEVAEISLDYDNMTLDDLKGIAKEKNITGYSNMKKEDLIAVLKAYDDSNNTAK